MTDGGPESEGEEPVDEIAKLVEAVDAVGPGDGATPHGPSDERVVGGETEPTDETQADSANSKEPPAVGAPTPGSNLPPSSGESTPSNVSSSPDVEKPAPSDGSSRTSPEKAGPSNDGPPTPSDETASPAAVPPTPSGEPADESDEEDVVQLVEELEAEADESDELDTDPRVERFGNYAGVTVTGLLALMLFVGPWRLFDLTIGDGMIPFALRESTEMNIVYVAPIAIALVGFLVGGVYRLTTDELPEDYRAGMVVQILVVQVLVAVALYALFMLVPIGSLLLDGSFVGALITLGIAVVYLLFFTFFEFLGMAIYVGIPSFVGVFLGSQLGRALN